MRALVALALLVFANAAHAAPVKAEEIVAICEAWAVGADALEREAKARGWDTTKLDYDMIPSEFTRRVVVSRRDGKLVDTAVNFEMQDVDYPTRRLSRCAFSDFSSNSGRMADLAQIMQSRKYSGPAVAASESGKVAGNLPPLTFDNSPFQLWNRSDTTMEIWAKYREEKVELVGRGTFSPLKFELRALQHIR